MIDDRYHRIKEPGCTCHLEQAFGVADPDMFDGQYAVFDAECEVVCLSKNKNYADLICWALNRLDSPRHEACRLHDWEGYWKPRYEAEE